MIGYDTVRQVFLNHVLMSQIFWRLCFKRESLEIALSGRFVFELAKHFAWRDPSEIPM